MGTRNLTIVKKNGKTKVAQYGQWDGYPTGQGETIVKFLENIDIKKFNKAIDALGEYTEQDIRDAYKESGHTGGDWVTSEVANRVRVLCPSLNRDHGANILNLINDGEVSKVKLDEDFKNDGLFCEYYYTIDLDDNTVSMNDGKKYKFSEWTSKLMKKLENQD